MNKRDVSDLMASDLQIKKFETYQFIDFFIQVITEQLQEGRKILISNFGTFQIVSREEKRVINPNNKKEMVIPQRRIVKFIPSKALKKNLKDN